MSISSSNPYAATISLSNKEFNINSQDNRLIYAKVTSQLSTTVDGKTVYLHAWDEYMPNFDGRLYQKIENGAYGTTSPSLNNSLMAVNGEGLTIGNYYIIRRRTFVDVTIGSFIWEVVGSGGSGGPATGCIYLTSLSCSAGILQAVYADAMCCP